MVGCNNEYLFPNFSKAALATTKSGKSASKVSSLWTKLFEDLRTKFDVLSDKINDRLSSHCNKKGSNQVMVNCSSVSGIAQVFRTYGTRGRDTIWEYLFMNRLPKTGDSILSKDRYIFEEVILDPIEKAQIQTSRKENVSPYHARRLEHSRQILEECSQKKEELEAAKLNHIYN